MVCKPAKGPQTVGQLLVIEVRQAVLQAVADSFHELGWVESKPRKRPHNVDDALLGGGLQPPWL